MRPAPSRFVALVLALLSSVRAAAPELGWPEFRGPTGQGLASAEGLPERWSETENVRWKTPVRGKGWSSPVVLGGQVWLTTATEDGRELSVFAFDQETGRVLHDRKLFTVAEPQYADKFNSYASPTPAIEPGRVYVTFGSPGTACLDTSTGEVLWERRDLPCNHWRGAGSSPTLWEGLLLLHFDGADQQYVVALDKRTGRTVWRTDRSIDFQDLTPEGKPIRDGDFRKAFSSPLVIRHEGRSILISAGSKATYAYDPATGRELWRVEERRHHSGTVRPIAGHGMVFTATGLPKGELWAVRLGGQGVINDSHVAWKFAKNVPNRPSPVLVGELLFMVHQDSGVVTCLEAVSGRELWSERLPGTGNYSASPVHAAGRLYFFNERGHGSVIAAGRDYRLLAENKLEEGAMASPAVVGRALYVRTRGHLYRLEQR